MKDAKQPLGRMTHVESLEGIYEELGAIKKLLKVIARTQVDANQFTGWETRENSDQKTLYQMIDDI